jgi:uncharacterized RmlC-like cupin family protein
MSDKAKNGQVVRAVQVYEGKQGASYGAGVSAESVGSEGLWLGSATIPPGGRTKAHIHEEHESGFYFVSGDEVEMFTGERLENRASAHAGDYLYIPANVRHVVVNRGTSPAVFIGARTDPNEQESVVMLPDLDQLIP